MSLLAETRIPLHLDVGVRGGGPAAPPAWERLQFEIEHQLQTQWCWAATSVSLARYYGESRGWSQCEMVSEIMGRECRADGTTPECDRPHRLDEPLDRLGILADWDDDVPDVDQLGDEIGGKRPVAWRIGWSGGGGHFAVIDGLDRKGDWVAVEDPWYGSSDVRLAALTGGLYQGTGTWTHTFFTRPPEG